MRAGRRHCADPNRGASVALLVGRLALGKREANRCEVAAGRASAFPARAHESDSVRRNRELRWHLARGQSDQRWPIDDLASQWHAGC